MWPLSLFRKTPSPPLADKGLFVFAIPLIGGHLTDKFDDICRLLSKTLQSCLRQTDRNYRILIACNEIPGADIVPQHTRIDYLVLKPISKSELAARPRHDVSVKRHALMRAAVDIRARHYFQLDADDLVSNRLVERVRSIGDENGCIIGQGYLLDSRTNQLYLLPTPSFPKPSFDGLCGSSIVVSLLQGVGEEIKIKNMEFLTRVWRLGHDSARGLFQSEGRPAHILDFPAAIYRPNHGGNLYMSLNRDERSSFIDEIASACKPLGGELLQSVREEFSYFE
jgi:hypothetical protein